MPSRSSSEIVDGPRGIANRPSQEFGGTISLYGRPYNKILLSWVGLRATRRYGYVQLKSLAVEEVSEGILLRRPIFGDLLTYPGDIHIVLHTDVLTRDIATPRTAAEAGRHRHSVVE